MTSKGKRHVFSYLKEKIFKYLASRIALRWIFHSMSSRSLVKLNFKNIFHIRIESDIELFIRHVNFLQDFETNYFENETNFLDERAEEKQ